MNKQLNSALKRMQAQTRHTSINFTAACLLIAGNAANAGPVAGVVTAANIALATTTAVTLALATIGFAFCGYKVMFDGATFRDISGKLFGAAICGAAGATAALFMA